MRIRKGGAGDVPAVMAMLDGAVRWLASRGRSDQWGSVPWSVIPERVRPVRRRADAGRLWIAEDGGAPAGALGLGAAPLPYVLSSPELESYVDLLVTERKLGRA